MKAINYIDKIREKFNASDYKAAQIVGISPARVSTYRRGKSNTFEDDVSIKVAELLDINPAEVIAEMHKEKAKTRKEKAIWEAITKAIRTTAAAFLMTAIIALASTNTPFDSVVYADAPQDNLYYVK